MKDMAATIIPRSDQWNYDDFLSGPLTFKITGVKIRPGTEQPVDFSLEGTDKFYRPCKSMCRVVVAAWGADSSKYIGRSITLYGDKAVKWGGMEVGGIRISHMSHIDGALTMALTVTRANKKPFTVRPLASGAKEQPKAAAKEGGGSQPVDRTHAEPDDAEVLPKGNQSPAVPPPSAAPSDDDIAASIKTLVKDGELDMAADLARSIKDEGRRAKAAEYIGKQREKAS